MKTLKIEDINKMLAEKDARIKELESALKEIRNGGSCDCYSIADKVLNKER